MQGKLSAAAILSTTAIASTILLTSINPASACKLSRSSYQQQANWTQSPWVALVTLPGIALAVALYLGDRNYQSKRS